MPTSKLARIAIVVPVVAVFGYAVERAFRSSVESVVDRKCASQYVDRAREICTERRMAIKEHCSENNPHGKIADRQQWGVWNRDCKDEKLETLRRRLRKNFPHQVESTAGEDHKRRRKRREPASEPADDREPPASGRRGDELKENVKESDEPAEDQSQGGQRREDGVQPDRPFEPDNPVGE